MSTYHSLHYHWVCATKERRPWVQPEWRSSMHEYLGGVVRGLGGMALMVGGVADHVHLLLRLRTTHCVADFSRELKKASSVWATESHCRGFGWQEGYAVFAVSQSGVAAVTRYVARQEEHHRRIGFEDELRALLMRHGLEMDARFLP